jgi:integrase
MKLNEKNVRSLEAPESGNRVYYFPEAIIQGAKAPRGFGVRVTAGGARAFVLNYRVARVEHRLTIGQYPDWSVLRAVKEARALRQRVDRGQDPLADRRTAEAAAADTLKTICEEYLAREGKRLRTAWQRRALLERLVYPALGGRQIDAIGRIEITRLLDRIEDENGARTADMTLAVIRKIMNWHAARSDEFRSPIVRGMARHGSVSRERILADDELRRVWAVASADGPFPALVKFLLLTAARRAEAAEVTWGELDGSAWTLPGARNKTKLDLLRPLSKAALEVLPQQIEGCNFVFSTDGKTPISGFSKFKRAFDAAVVAIMRKQDPEAKPLPPWTLHDLRRSARSLMSRAGVDADIAERCLGHVIPGVRSVYDRHKYFDQMLRAYELLAAEIERILNPPTNVVTPIHKGRARA